MFPRIFRTLRITYLKFGSESTGTCFEPTIEHSLVRNFEEVFIQTTGSRLNIELVPW